MDLWFSLSRCAVTGGSTGDDTALPRGLREAGQLCGRG